MYKRFILVLVSVLALSLTGCSTIAYYNQSIQGHFDLMGKSRPISEYLKDDSVDSRLRKKLELVLEMRKFATTELKLPKNDSYKSFAHLDRKAVVWNVVATSEFSVTPRQWCYPVIGCASYRGYFKQAKADAYAAKLENNKLDVAVEPAAAYSTLGWFEDPLPSTVIHWPESQLIGLIVHELSHQQLYIKDDSTFNESFATAVEQVGVERWFKYRGDMAGFKRWQVQKRRQKDFFDLLLDNRKALQRLYDQDIPEGRKRRLKAQQFARLHSGYKQLKQSWNGYAGFDHWFKREVNNARLASVATYTKWVPSFLQLLEEQGGDMEGFYQASARLGRLGSTERNMKLKGLAEKASP